MILKMKIKADENFSGRKRSIAGREEAALTHEKCSLEKKKSIRATREKHPHSLFLPSFRPFQKALSPWFKHTVKIKMPIDI